MGSRQLQKRLPRMMKKMKESKINRDALIDRVDLYASNFTHTHANTIHYSCQSYKNLYTAESMYSSILMHFVTVGLYLKI